MPMEVPDPSTVNCREAMIWWDVAKIALDSSAEFWQRGRRAARVSRCKLKSRRLLGLSLLGHLLGGCLGNFHERQLQAADHFDPQIVIFPRQIPARSLPQ